jgi:hypothetical protein
VALLNGIFEWFVGGGRRGFAGVELHELQSAAIVAEVVRLQELLRSMHELLFPHLTDIYPTLFMVSCHSFSIVLVHFVETVLISCAY